jgi:hypothetical protein
MFPELEARLSDKSQAHLGSYFGVSSHLVYNLGTPELVARYGRAYQVLPDRHDTLHAWLYRTGLNALDLVRDTILKQYNKADTEKLLTEFARMVAPEVAPVMLELRLSCRAPGPATAWLESHPAHAIAGLVPLAGGRGKLADAALAYLRGARRKGFGEFIALQLQRHPSAAVERIHKELLEQVEKPLTPFDEKSTPDWLRAAQPAPAKARKSSKAKTPAWLRLDSLPPIAVGERHLNDEQVQALLGELRGSSLEQPRPLVSAVRQNVDMAVRDDFAWGVFDCWLEGGARASDRWGILTLGLLGGDGVALKLAPLLRAWPG